MDARLTQERIVEGNAREYGPLFSYMNWIDEARAADAQAERNARLCVPEIRVSCLGTKIHHGPLSPGCRQCAEKNWSCLFISGRCNGHCFYCPTPQNVDDPPMSASVPFLRPEHFAAYVSRFGFGGASVSGGEPFLDFDRSLEYVRAVRKTCGPGLHIWLYTNGMLVTEDKLELLAAAGLNEIRFDIGATAYDLKFVRKAKGIIQTVTIEIPAVPEERERLRRLLPGMHEAGVSHLNLHQLRLTPHNARHLLERDYTFVHGPKVTVLESELCALDLVAFATENRLPLAINYCSFAYKSRFQAAASREKFGSPLLEEGESLTGSGFIRSMQPAPEETCRGRERTRISYSAAYLRPLPNPNFPHREVRLADGFAVVLERHPFLTVTHDEIERQTLGRPPEPDPELPGLFAPSLEESCEWITPGLGLYF